MRCGARSDGRVRRRGFGRAGRSRTRRSPRCPSRSPACPISTNCASAGHRRAWLRHLRVCENLLSPPGCGGMRCGPRSDARVRRRGFGRAGGSLTHRSPRCPSRSAACPISAHCACAGHLRARCCGTCALALVRVGRAVVRHLIGCACATSRVRPCSVLENTPIAALPESFTSLSNLIHLCVRRAPARNLWHLRDGASLTKPRCGGIRCGTG
jgi:hypothetical protein